ncbi:hypothetical protein ABPG72_019653 [Tetrahymena utriculariae]
MGEPIKQQNSQAVKARTIQMYDNQQISHTLEIQSSRIAGSNSSITNQQNSRKKKKRYFKEDVDLKLQHFNGSYNDDFESPVQSKYISQSNQVSSFGSLSKYSISKERSKNFEKPLTNQEINKLFMETNSSQKVKKNDLLKTKVYIDQYMNNRSELENQQSSIDYEQSSVNNQKFTENSKNQTITSYQTKQGEIYSRQALKQSQSPDRAQEKSQYKVDEFDFKKALAKVHKINAYEPKVYRQLQLPNYQNHNYKTFTAASTQQDQTASQRYQFESETSISCQNENQSPRSSNPISQEQQYHPGQNKQQENIEEIKSISSSNNNNNLVYRKKIKLKKKNLNINQNEQIDMIEEYENLEQNIQPDGSIRVDANRFLLSNRGSQMQAYATPSNIQKILNSTKQVRRKSFVFHNSPKIIKNAYGVDQSDLHLKYLRDQFKEKVKEIQEFNKNHTNFNFYKRSKQPSSVTGRAQSPSNLIQTQNGFYKTPKYADKQNKQYNLQENNNFNINPQEENNQNLTNTIQIQNPTSSHPKKRRKSYNHPSRQQQQIQLPQVLQNTFCSNTPHHGQQIQNLEPQDQLFKYVSQNLPKKVCNQQQEEKNQQTNNQKIVIPIRSKTPNIKISKSRNNTKNSPKRFTNTSKLKSQYSPTQLNQNSPRNKQF